MILLPWAIQTEIRWTYINIKSTFTISLWPIRIFRYNKRMWKAKQPQLLARNSWSKDEKSDRGTLSWYKLIILPHQSADLKVNIYP